MEGQQNIIPKTKDDAIAVFHPDQPGNDRKNATPTEIVQDKIQQPALNRAGDGLQK